MTKSKPEFKIESEVPLPQTPYRSKYPWRKLKINDSFFVPVNTKGMACGMYVMAKRYGIKITARAVDGGLRIWRVK